MTAGGTYCRHSWSIQAVPLEEQQEKEKEEKKMNIVKHYGGALVRYLRATRAVAAMEYAIIVGVIVVGVGAGRGSVPGRDRGNHRRT